MEVKTAEQRYTCVHRGTSDLVLYEGLAAGQRVVVTVDSDGLILDYPRVFRRTFQKR